MGLSTCRRHVSTSERTNEALLQRTRTERGIDTGSPFGQLRDFGRVDADVNEARPPGFRPPRHRGCALPPPLEEPPWCSRGWEVADPTAGNDYRCVSLLPYRIVHYSQQDPRAHVGGVETFARSLGLIFEEVEFMTPATLDVERVRRQRLPVVCDNHFVLDFPADVPVIGFQHGVARVKFASTRNWGDLKRLRLQAKAARRPNVTWVACAQWISETFGRLHGNRAEHVIYHPVDLDRFDGRLTGERPRLVLHDARTEHKGKHLVEHLARAFPDWEFEALDCRPEEVPARMRSAQAFVHLSRYEGNSIVCNEAMAMNLPCFFTRVGLMQDADGPKDVYLVDPGEARRRPQRLVEAFGDFVSSLGTRAYRPRVWSERHASPEASRRGWERVVATFLGV